MADVDNSTDSYRIKDIIFFGSPRRILLQSANGPCPLLALCNVLLLRNQLRISTDSRYIGFGELVQIVSNHLFDTNAVAASGEGGADAQAADVRESLGSCLDILPHLNVGLDVNCKFGGPKDFEYTRELAVFDMCDINLFHGWVVSKQDEKAYKAFGHLSYNQIVERLIAFEEEQQKQTSGNAGAPSEEAKTILEEGLLIKEFMNRTASQLSYEGLLELHQVVKERELAVFFRNSHFSAIMRYGGELYLLCTDIAFSASDIVWERLDQVDGDTAYCDANFKEHVEAPIGLTSAQAAEESAIAAAAAGDDDAALRLEQGAMDEMIAWQMQQEEQLQAEAAALQQAQAMQARGGAAPAAPARTAASAPAQGQARPAAGAGPAAAAAQSGQGSQGASAPKSKKKSNRSCVVQ
mmetsp:Transcript_11349/g.26170  ORF Transcript_11349/g.26170 Transcript_11349/m.26170 type:complete len:409 (+) Transcript_11349:111-1337(+)